MPLLCRAKPLYVYYQQGENLNSIIANLSRPFYISIASRKTDPCTTIVRYHQRHGHVSVHTGDCFVGRSAGREPARGGACRGGFGRSAAGRGGALDEPG